MTNRVPLQEMHVTTCRLHVDQTPYHLGRSKQNSSVFLLSNWAHVIETPIDASITRVAPNYMIILYSLHSANTRLHQKPAVNHFVSASGNIGDTANILADFVAVIVLVTWFDLESARDSLPHFRFTFADVMNGNSHSRKSNYSVF